MEIFIDQSGRLEFTKVDTVIAYSNSYLETKSILIEAKEKRKLQSYFRKNGNDKVYIYKTFAILIYILLENKFKYISSLNIDMEYEGREILIKNFLLDLIFKNNKKIDSKQINFVHVGKKHKCHDKAIRTFRKEIKPDIKVDADLIFRKFLK